MANTKEVVWIESDKTSKGYVMKIGTEWGCYTRGFKRADYMKLFEAVSSAVKSVFPNVDINPWEDDEHGIPDIG